MSAPLILAIQPDRRQASQLASIVRGISAELILAESTEKAIAELGDRPPDLILTPALLSFKDEKKLTDRLHEFGDAAAHTQTLTTPILEIDAAPTRGGKSVLSSLRKPKKKGKAQVPEIGCTPETFAEQITIYLNRAVEARCARPKQQTAANASKAAARSEAAVDAPVADVPAAVPEPAATSPVEAMQPAAEAAATLEYVPVEQAVFVPPADDRPAASDGLPTIEELSARTPAVPEPDSSVDTNMDAIAAMVPSDDAESDRSVPTPEAMPTVAELQVDVPVMETASVDRDAPAVPESAGQIDTTMEAVAAMVPIDGTGDPAVPMPDAMPAVADMSMELAASNIAVQGDAMPAAPQLDESVDMTMEAVAAAVPFADAPAYERPVPMPAAMPKVADLAMELTAADLAPSMDAMPAAPEPAESGVDAVAAMMPIVSASSDDRLVPAPAAMARVVELSMELLPDIAATVDQSMPAAPEPDRSVDASLALVAAAVPRIGTVSEDPPVAMPASLPAVVQLSMEVPSLDMQAAVDEFVPAPEPRASFEPGVAFAELAPMVNTTHGNVLVPMPGDLPAVADLAIGLPAVDSPPIDDIPAVPHAAQSIDMSLDAVDGLGSLFDDAADAPAAPPVPVAAAPVTELAPPAPQPARTSRKPMPVIAPKPMSPAMLQRMRRADRKKAQLQSRKARKKMPKREEATREDSFFDPDQIQFSALIAKLDEVAPRNDDPHAASGNTARKPQPSKTRTR